MSASSRRIALISLITLALASAAVIFVGGMLHPEAIPPVVAGERLKPLVVKGDTIFVFIADTEEERALGLGGREELAPNHGMLFIFPDEGIYGFWMKDMHFAIDIIWIANDGSVLHIEERLSPDTYPRMYASEAPARYVLEVNAGFAEERGIDVGDKVAI